SPQLPEMQQEAEEEAKQQLSAHMSYKYEELRSRASVSPGLDIPEDLLHLSHSFGFDSRRRANLGVLDDSTLIFIAGNLMVLLDVHAQEQRFLRSSGGGGIGAIAVHPSREFFAVAEKGTSPDIIVYEYPSLRPGRILRGGTRHRYSCVSFNHDGSLLASVGGEPDFLLTLWDWRREEVQSFQATSQEVHRVSFSHYDQELLTTAGCRHINFWKLSTTFTGFKLEKLAGHFGNSVASDIEGVLELPDGEVVSGTEWGNLLLWDGNSIKAEICCKDGRSCHSGTAQPFALEGGKLLTFGSDGAVRSWDFERISSFTCDGGGSRLEVEPINELVVGRHVCLSSVVKSSLPGSSVWFAQDSNGGIWNLDLSFSPSVKFFRLCVFCILQAADPRRLLSCPSGPIKGLDVSKTSHLMATTALDCSVRVFDLLAKREVTSSCFNQGGTALSWAPLTVNQKGGLLVTGFEDGVVRLLELRADSGVSAEEHTRLHLKQALKPHSAAVTAVAFQPDGHILATGSEDQTVFFFTVGEACHPLGFIHVPGPVQALEWSPDSHNGRRLLILCRSGHALEVESPDLEAERSPQSFHLPELPRRCFGFSSITSRMKVQHQREPQTERMKIRREEVEKQEGEKPQPPGPLLCGFYSEPGQFWLSMGGFDSGYLYHCKFSEDQSEEPCRRQDEPFDFLLVSGADDDPICSMTFSRQLLLCGMHSGTIRVYPLRPGDLAPADMQAYWALSVHDNHYGHLRHIRCSFDDLFVLTAGDDGNIFSFSRVPPEESQRGLQRQRARIPSPRVRLKTFSIWGCKVRAGVFIHAFHVSVITKLFLLQIIQQKSEMNRRITNLRDAKIRLVSWLSAQAKRLQKIHHGLGTDLRRSPPPLPSMSPEEMPERKLQCSSATLDGYRAPTRQGCRGLHCSHFRRPVGLQHFTLWLFSSSGGRALSRRCHQELTKISVRHRLPFICGVQMESSISRFDSELLLLRQQKVRLDIHLKQADLHLLTLFQETVILGSFEEREASLQEKSNISKETWTEQLKQRRRVIEELQEDEEALAADFQASVAENHHYEDLLTKIFKKKAARKKKEKRAGSPSEEDSDDSLEDWDGCIDSDMEEEDGSSVDDKVCPTGCDPDLFRKILQLRERRWDLEEMLVEAGKSADALKKESDGLITKVGKVLKSSQQRIEEEVELINKDKLQKMKQVEVVVPFRLHQIQFLSNGSVPSDLSEALVLDKSEMDRLRRRVQQLQVEKEAEEGRLLQAQRQRSRLIRENKEMTLEKQCNELMMLKYGRLLDVEALLSMSGQKKLDKLKEEKLLLEAEHAKELKRWKVCQRGERRFVCDQRKCGAAETDRRCLQFQDHRRLEDREDIRKLQELVQAQEQQAQALLRRIHLLSSKEGCVLPPETTRLPPLAPAHGPLPSTRGRPLRGHDD
uniref:Uncharacterized protein n=1 Tax=Oryzias latipes TaxID=8090 RepID=H2MJA2_ORYLA